MRNLIISLIFLATGCFFKYLSQQIDVGTMADMGPGYFPDLISTLLIIVSVLIMIKQLIWKS